MAKGIANFNLEHAAYRLLDYGPMKLMLSVLLLAASTTFAAPEVASNAPADKPVHATDGQMAALELSWPLPLLVIQIRCFLPLSWG